MANLINCENISKSFGLKTLLDGVSLGVQEGDRIGVVGLNGGGKSTLLKILAGVEPADSGRISRANDMAMAHVTQGAELDPNSTVFECVIAPLGLAEHEWAGNASIREVLDGIGINDLGMDTKVANLSGGERRRVNLAAALVRDLDLLILDEPTRGIDVGAKYEIYEIIDKLADQGKAVIVISSELPELIGICDRIYTVSQGVITDDVNKNGFTQEYLMKCMTKERN